jgi:hypothetical protein
VAAWDRGTTIAMVWTRAILAGRDLALFPAPRTWAAAVADPWVTQEGLQRHRLVGAAATSLSSLSPAGDALSSWLRVEARQAAVLSLAHAAVASRIRETLSVQGIPCLFTKGVFQSKQSTGELAFRGVGDIDVVVPPDDFEGAVAALVREGAEHVTMTSHVRLNHHLAAVHHATSLFIGGVHVDLHRRLDPNPQMMSVPFAELWECRDIVEVQGHHFPTLSPVDTCVYVASHGSQDNWPYLRGVLDLVLAVARAGDLEAVVDRASRQGVSERLAIGLEVARVLAPDLPPQGAYARRMANWSWSRHRQGRAVRGSDKPRDVMSTFAYWLLSEPGASSLIYAARRLAWLPSSMESAAIPDRLWWAYPILAPVNVSRRVIERWRSSR